MGQITAKLRSTVNPRNDWTLEKCRLPVYIEAQYT